MKVKSKILLLPALLLIILGALYFYYGYLYKEARVISKEQPVFNTAALRLAKEFQENIDLANRKYLNKTIEIKGAVTQISDSVITLDSVAFCSMDKPLANTALNKIITIKGRCIGYDELFNEVKLDQCMIKE